MVSFIVFNEESGWEAVYKFNVCANRWALNHNEAALANTFD
jgi:hypothetical protein